MCLETQELAIRVPGRTLCLGLNLKLSVGENWAILGANGSGKTTLMHTLAGLRPADAGQVILDGRDINDYPHRARARHIGILFQDYGAGFPATVMETALTGRHPYLSRWQWQDDIDDVRLAKDALTAVGLDGFEARRLATLSGGERRRVEIAALLTQDPRVCLLDEPTNYLDLRHQIDMLELLAQRGRQAKCLNLFVLHDVNLALRFCTHALLLFGNGECLHGEMPSILDAERLRRLYGCPIRQIESTGRAFYTPA